MSIEDAESVREQHMEAALEQIEEIVEDPKLMSSSVAMKIREIIRAWRNPPQYAFGAVLDEVVITTPVKKCDKCPHMDMERTPGAGYALDWFCKKMDNKKIAGYIEWDRDAPKVPEWCPYRNSKENNFTKARDWIRQKREDLMDEIEGLSQHESIMWTKGQRTMCSIILDMMDEIVNGQ